MRGIRFLAGFRVITDGKQNARGNIISVENATDTKILFSCETSFNGFDNHPYLEGKEYKKPVEKRLREFTYSEETKSSYDDYYGY